MPPKSAKSKEAPAERPILGRFSSHLKIGIVCFSPFLSAIVFNFDTILSTFFNCKIRHSVNQLHPMHDWFYRIVQILIFLHLNWARSSELFAWLFLSIHVSYCYSLFRLVCQMLESLLFSIHSPRWQFLLRISPFALLSLMRQGLMFLMSVSSGFVNCSSQKVRFVMSLIPLLVNLSC